MGSTGYVTRGARVALARVVPHGNGASERKQHEGKHGVLRV